MGAPENKHWIVKSSGRILGPFSTDEVKNEIINRNVSLVDEIQAPGSRWRYIREEQSFIEAVRSLRIEQENSREDTMTSTLSSQTITQTDTIEMAPEDIDISSQTILKKSDSFSAREAPPIKNLKTQSPQAAPQTVNPTPPPQFKAAPKAYGLSQDARVQKSLKKSNSLIWILSLALIGMFGFFIYDKLEKAGNMPVMQGPSFEELYQLGLRARSLGFYDRALAYLRQAEKLNPKSPENNFQVAVLEIALERQTLLGRRKLETVLTQKADMNTNAEGYGAIGLSFAYEGDTRQALEAYQKSSSTNENFWQAKFNQATIEYLQGQYERALATLVSIETGSSNELIVLLSKAILNIELAKKDSSYLSSSEDLFFNLHRYSRKTSEFRQEAFLLMMAYYTLRKQSEQATGVLGEFLDSDPYSTDEYIQDLLIDKRIVNWQNLKKICDATLPLLANSPQVQAANALCHTKAGEELKAKSFISVALARAPKDAQVLALSSFLNRESGRDMEARANLKMSTQIGLSKLNASLQARLCEAENQAACAKEYWQKLLSFDANSIEALNGLAWLGYNSRNQEESRKNMERGLLISGSYRPLLELRETGSL